MRNKFSGYIYVLSCIILAWTSLNFYPKWQKENGEAAISYDVAGYYWYLPSLFIYHDLKHQSFADTVIKKYKMTPELPGYKTDNGNYVLKYSSGMALMYLPYFTIAHLYARSSGYPPDGFSAPYQLAIQLSGLLISIIGLWYFRNLLLLFYGDAVVAISMLLLVIGTNYIDFAAINIGMSHTWLFTLYVLLLLNTINFYKGYQYKYAIKIGLLIGLLALARPTEIIACLIPFLWGLENVFPATIKSRITLLWQQWKKIIVTAVCALAVLSIQLVYWKYVSGHWLQYSYQDQGFSWLHPHVRVYAFNYRSGWITYAPMLLFAIIGIVPFFKYGKNRVAILLFFALNYYIVSAWDIWWYGGRAMIQSYPILFFPFASFVDYAVRRRGLLFIAAPVVLLFIYFNVWLTYHEHKGTMYTPDNMTKAYFWRVAGRWSVPDETVKLRDNPDLFEGAPQNMHLLYQNDFESDSSLYCPVPPIAGHSSVYIDNKHTGSIIYKFPYTGNGATWLRAQATFRSISKEWTYWAMTQFIVHYYNKGKEIKVAMIRADRFLNDGETKDLYIDSKIPREAIDTVGISFWCPGNDDKKMLVDNLRVWSFNE